MAKDVTVKETPLEKATKDCDEHAIKGVMRSSLRTNATLGNQPKSMIFEDVELVVTLRKLAMSPQGNEVQQETEVETGSLPNQEKDDEKTQLLLVGELDEQASLEAQATFKKAMRLTIGRVKHDGWQRHFIFDPI